MRIACIILTALVLGACSGPAATTATSGPTTSPESTSSCAGSSSGAATPSRCYGVAGSPTPITSPSIEPTGMPAPSSTPTILAEPTLGVGSSKISAIDRMEQLYVPAGPFLMGWDGGYPDEAPQHTVTLSAYWVDRTEVTNGMYGLCVQAGACKPPARVTSNTVDHYFGNPQYADFPVIFVDWAEADAYCTWAGRSLPTEAEWEKAARGTDGRLYPWGNAAPDPSLALYANHIEDTVAVGSYPAGASPHGALDMAGNVWEWTSGWYSLDYYAQSPAENPPGPESGTLKVLRGGSWNFDTPGLRSTYRLAKDPAFVHWDAGFRCVERDVSR